jgi:hypothetical protein
MKRFFSFFFPKIHGEDKKQPTGGIPEEEIRLSAENCGFWMEDPSSKTPLSPGL